MKQHANMYFITCVPAFEKFEPPEFRIKLNQQSIHTVMSVLVNVPANVGHSIVSEWLRAKSVAQLDVTYCTASERKLFLDLLADTITLEADSDFSNSADRLRWMTIRKVKCHSFFYYENEVSTELIPVLSAFFNNSAKTVKTVKIDLDDAGLVLLLGYIAANRCSLRRLDCDNADAPDVDQVRLDDVLEAVTRNSAGDLQELHLNVGSQSCFTGDVCCAALATVGMRIQCDEDLISLS